jgi:transketolase
MRNAFADEITKLAKQDSRIVLLSGDIGNKLFDPLKKVDDTRFYNCGIAEGNMMGVAAGMALSGLRPVVYTITPFNTTRCFEQIRVDVCYHKAPVVIVGTGAGLSYAELGPTHHSLEDIAILRTLPEMRIISPCDPNELRAALGAALLDSSPTYIRIGKKGEEEIFVEPPQLSIGKCLIVKPGVDLALICTGTLMGEAIRAAELLKQRGLSAEIVSMHTVKPLDFEYLISASKRFKHIVTIEEHGLIGGLGGAVSEWCTKERIKINHIMFGTPDEFMHEVGSQQYARNKYGLLSKNIADKVHEKMIEVSE